jgi:hypothetical protein
MPPARDLHFAIAVGINRYPDPRLVDLRFPRSDARAFARWLHRADGVPWKNIKVITTPQRQTRPWVSASQGRPVRDEINTALDLFKDRVRAHVKDRPDDWQRTRLYVFVAGHGYGIPHGPTALIMANARHDKLGEAIAVGPYLDWLERCGDYREIVFLADCCRNEYDDAPDPPDPPFNRCTTPVRDVRIMLGYATLPGGVASGAFTSTPDEGRGYFTRLLIAGLRGKALAEGDAITAGSLRDYIHDNLPAEARERQLARIIVMGGDIVFRPGAQPRPAGVGSPDTALHDVVVEFGSGYRGAVTLVGPENEPRDQWHTIRGPWSLRLQKGLWLIRLDDLQPPKDEMLRVPEQDHVEV